MKRLRKKHIVLIALAALLILRELGPFGFSAYTSRSEASSSFDVAGAQVYDRVQHIAYEDDHHGRPTMPKASADGIVIRERFFYKVDWTSWIPLYKTGKVEVVRVFSAYDEKGLCRCTRHDDVRRKIHRERTVLTAKIRGACTREGKEGL